MRIYYLNTTLGYNATGNLVRMLAHAAGTHGHTVAIAYDRGGRLPGEQAFRPGGAVSRMAHALRTRLSDGHGLGSRHATDALIAEMERFGPDVVHLHNLHGYWLNLPRLMSWLAASGVRIIWTLHDFWPLTGHCAFPQQVGCDRWTDGCGCCPLTHEYPASWWRDRSAANYRDRRAWLGALPGVTLVAVSEWQRSEIVRGLGGGCPCVTVCNPVDTEVFRPGIAVRSPLTVLGAASVWDARKGLDRFVRLRASLPTDFRIVLAGLSPRQIKSLPPGIEGRPRISGPRQMARFMASGGVFVNLSSAETLGMVNIEARACGTPVVSLASGGLAETVTPSSGFLLDGFDPAVAAARIAEAAERGRFDNDAIAHEAASRFNPQNLIGRYLNLYGR